MAVLVGRERHRSQALQQQRNKTQMCAQHAASLSVKCPAGEYGAKQILLCMLPLVLCSASYHGDHAGLFRSS